MIKWLSLNEGYYYSWKVECERVITGKNGLNKEDTTINKFKYRYDKGFVENMKEIYSDNKLVWFIPEMNCG